MSSISQSHYLMTEAAKRPPEPWLAASLLPRAWKKRSAPMVFASLMSLITHQRVLIITQYYVIAIKYIQ